MTEKTQWSTVIPFLNGVASPALERGLPKWLDEENAQRLSAYSLYDDIYQNNPNQYVLLLRGNEERPVYIPSAKRIIDTMNRYVARRFNFTLEDADPEIAASPEDIAASALYLENFFARESLRGKFNAAKRRGLIRGDWCFFIYANENKPDGERVSIKSIHPKTVFPITNGDGKVTGYELVERFIDPADDKYRLRVQKYINGYNSEHPAFESGKESEAEIIYGRFVYEEKGWQDPEEREIKATEVQPEPIKGITRLPVYHFKNNDDYESPFGTSELAGVEHIIAAINQGATDLDISLAMAGLGMYWTDSGKPRDNDGNVTDWIVGPGRVVEVVPDRKFDRVSGVASSDPVLNHLRYLDESIDSSFGISDVVTGRAEVSIAESGIALALRMGPIIDASDEKDEAITATLVQMLHDLKQWLSVFEGFNMDAIKIVPTFDPKTPRNRDAEFQELLTLFQENLITPEYLLNTLNSKFGYDFSAQMIKDIVAKKEQMSESLIGGEGEVDNRLDEEAGDEDGGEGSEG